MAQGFLQFFLAKIILNIFIFYESFTSFCLFLFCTIMCCTPEKSKVSLWGLCFPLTQNVFFPRVTKSKSRTLLAHSKKEEYVSNYGISYQSHRTNTLPVELLTKTKPQGWLRRPRQRLATFTLPKIRAQ